LLLALLDSHPQILTFPEETKFLRRVVDNPDNQSLAFFFARTHCRFLAESQLVTVAGERDYRAFDGARFKAYAEAYAEIHRAEMPRNLLEAIVTAYGLVLGREPPRFWTEKTPQNELELRAARRLWPEAKAVYIMRDPRDVYDSYSRKLKAAAKPHDLSPDEFAASFHRSLRFWDKAVRLFPAQTYLLCYETLTREPVQEMARIAEFLGAEFHDALLRPTRMGQAWEGNSMRAQTFDSVSAASVGGFRTSLPEDVVAQLNTRFTDILERFGYPL
jgi:hypothetical protein